ncbi:hypothetical protein BXZ70DRAFT_35497 [Cristinia sonorae]|uniref:Uncharacterized protein n=1 Tax=Cristinia sonorae TaxID=1940300 RepID=A0A8K0UYQ8_9AGAR|nr:hypothetical protein BXZ70DRAFT_35497 [Cristinia sonorae]
MKSTGLVSTSVWSWYGKKSNPGEREERKIQEMARRYNTTLIPVRQYAEPTEMVTVLGGQLAIRQGTRARWSRENTAMHIVRSSDDVTFIDEIELGSRNLCSGFSYCLSLLETFYVWYATNSAVIELTEGENDDDEMFWMMLGEQEYARADYWQWRGSLTGVSPRLWRLEDRTHPVSFNLVYGLTTERQPNEHIYLADCVLEYYILVGKEARDSLKKIRLALSAASELSSRTQHSKPFAPPVHVLIFPSQIPEDLRLTFRDLDDFDSEQSPYPDHINLLSLEEAHQHLQQATWSRSLVKDTTMLPLGIHPSDL